MSPEDLAGIDAVVHLAAISNDSMGSAYEDATLEINAAATGRLAQLARSAGARRFVFASSCSVYGRSGPEWCDELSPPAPLTVYGRSKLLAEEMLARLAGRNFQVTCLRFATACGLSPRLRLDLVLNEFTAAAVAGRRIELRSDGTAWRPLVHVRDVARAIEWALGREAAAGEECLVVNAGATEHNFRVRELAQAVAEAIPGVEVVLDRQAAADGRSYRVGFERYRHLAPRHYPAERLPRAIQEMQEALGNLYPDGGSFRGPRWVRLRALEELCERGRLGADLRWRIPREASA